MLESVLVFVLFQIMAILLGFCLADLTTLIERGRHAGCRFTWTDPMVFANCVYPDGSPMP